MLKELQEKWDCLQTKNLSIEEISKLFQETVEGIRDQVIPSFFISEFDNVHLLYEKVGEDHSCEILSLDFPITEMNEYQGGLREYIEQALDKISSSTANTDEIVSDIALVNERSKGFVASLFSESVNAPTQMHSDEGLNCLDHLIDIKNKCDEFLESGVAMSQIIETCNNEKCRDGLSKVYFESSAKYLLDYVDTCFHVYEQVSDSILKKEHVKESLQVF